MEPCAIYYNESPSETAGDIAHVVARTTGAHRKYYYRRNEYGSWTPWEQISLDIEDNPVLPVVWKGRLLLFWLRILKSTSLDPQTVLPTDSSFGDSSLANVKLNDLKKDTKTNALANNAPVQVQAVLCWSEYYNGKWQPMKTSDVNNPLDLGSFSPIGQTAFDRSKLQLFNIEEGNEGEVLRVYIYHKIGQSDVYSSFRLYNTHSLPVPMIDEQDKPNTFPTGLNRFKSGDQYTLAFKYQNIHETSAPIMEIRVLQVTDPKHNPSFTIIEPGHPLQNSWVAPFFFQDSRHAFYVDTSLPLVPLSHFSGFGLAINQVQQHLDIPRLVFKQAPTPIPIPGASVPMSIEPHLGIMDSSPIERLVPEGITVRISTGAAVRYGDSEIGPDGGLLNGSTSRSQAEKRGE